MDNLENKAKEFFKRIRNSAARIGTIGMLSALALLSGCVSQINYRARVQTKPAEEIDIYIDGEEEGKTSKTGPVYVESLPYIIESLSRPKFSQCKITLKANKYEAFFIMDYDNDTSDLLKNPAKKIRIVDVKDRAKNCLEARVTAWEKGISYDLLFEIPEEVIAELHKSDKPEKKYTEWGDKIKEEEPKEKAKISEYVEPRKATEETKKPASLADQVQELQLARERDRLAWREFDKKGWFGPACLNLLVPGIGHFFYESYTLGAIHLGITLTTGLLAARSGGGSEFGRSGIRATTVFATIAGIHALECFFETIFVASDYNRAEFRKKYPKVYVGFDPNEKTAFVGINYKF